MSTTYMSRPDDIAKAINFKPLSSRSNSAASSASPDGVQVDISRVTVEIPMNSRGPHIPTMQTTSCKTRMIQERQKSDSTTQPTSHSDSGSAVDQLGQHAHHDVVACSATRSLQTIQPWNELVDQNSANFHTRDDIIHKSAAQPVLSRGRMMQPPQLVTKHPLPRPVAGSLAQNSQLSQGGVERPSIGGCSRQELGEQFQRQPQPSSSTCMDSEQYDTIGNDDAGHLDHDLPSSVYARDIRAGGSESLGMLGGFADYFNYN
ncbi:hypothetical protein T440DRAFT_284801 [Plenodomus tracheiphilus IPT5]|uniref:Uncharacterized protein n=1 Tax=Plenodomus tracheiphilus IPT5 TaxID=1408161 RepID=A0A6A7AS77_9PLEO|nr:hypothetical protein T440DRAFT_284801 [Plenodomus tracheiphilus IPT5]